MKKHTGCAGKIPKEAFWLLFRCKTIQVTAVVVMGSRRLRLWAGGELVLPTLGKIFQPAFCGKNMSLI
jgi:hypothetical protein